MSDNSPTEVTKENQTANAALKTSNFTQSSFRENQSRPLGQILLQTTELTEDKLEEALTISKNDEHGRKLGEILVQKRFVTEEELLKALAFLEKSKPYK